ncbi:MAG: phenylacetate-CoA oxygenase subunit PaaJ [Saprospiraceae bacterium]|nr:phenylacetate-CoA oxygenase subunit PaaJ [Saprospiraceae bacterium]
MKNPITKLVESIGNEQKSPLPEKKPENANEVIQLLSQITDPEIPVINIHELGILRNVTWNNTYYEVTITPTYVGCPAMGMIEMSIRQVLDQYSIPYKIITSLHPSWTTDWITDIGKFKLKEYGIAPPSTQKRIQNLFEGQGIVECPRCNSANTILISEFASTACKSLYKCNECLEPFDYFKCH